MEAAQSRAAASRLDLKRTSVVLCLNNFSAALAVQSGLFREYPNKLYFHADSAHTAGSKL